MLLEHLLSGCEWRRRRRWCRPGDHLPAGNCLRRRNHAIRGVGPHSHDWLTAGRHRCPRHYRTSLHL